MPDEPVTSFELTLPEGPYSALTALGNLCAATKTVTVKKKVTVKVHGRKKTITRKVKKTEPATLQMPTEFVAQNGAEIHQDTPVAVTGCPKAARRRRRGAGERSGSGAAPRRARAAGAAVDRISWGLTVALRCVTLRQESGSPTVGSRVHRVWLGSCRFVVDVK